MADSRRLQIIEALKARVEAIDGTGDFNTTAGANVLVNEEPKFGTHDPKVAIVMLVKEDQGGELQLGNIPLLLPIDFVAMVAPTLDAPWRQTELVLADIKKAIELEDRSLGGLLTGGRNNPEGLMRGTTEVFYRQNGSEAAGLLITYAAKYVEAWGFPEA